MQWSDSASAGFCAAGVQPWLPVANNFAARLDPKALRAVLADFQNSEQSNIRRVFGYTTLFQPKKPATRAEAASALWYFGSQGEGLSAKDALQMKRQQSLHCQVLLVNSQKLSFLIFLQNFT